jgi:hypothetical protein
MVTSRKSKLRGRELREEFPVPKFDDAVRGCLGHVVRLSRIPGESYGQIVSTPTRFDVEVVDFTVGRDGKITEVVTRVVMPGLAANGLPCKISPRYSELDFVKRKGAVFLLFWRKLSRKERSLGSASDTWCMGDIVGCLDASHRGKPGLKVRKKKTKRSSSRAAGQKA